MVRTFSRGLQSVHGSIVFKHEAVFVRARSEGVSLNMVYMFALGYTSGARRHWRGKAVPV